MNEPVPVELPQEIPTLPSVIFSTDEVMMLWQMVNGPNVATPLKSARMAAGLYDTIRQLAKLHGIRTD